ncbi:MAG TPA: uracil-DNA glycosylase [Blastocatellia bacterium]|nr:uracil-DNA glycosylase [Blastocatellia bacterium]
MNPREELRELIAQAEEHLRYYSELGLTHVGEISAAAVSEPKFEDRVARQVAAPMSAASEPKRREQPTPTIIPPPQFIPKPTVTMPTKQENASESSLFGEAAPSSAETQYSNETLEDIRRDLGDCRRCKLFSTRANIVFGEGAAKAELMFVGEGPGADENATGRPFVGRAGQLLTKMIEAIDLKREDVYIANVVKSRPPGNRAPESDEVKECIPFLFRQIAAIRPKLIVALGNPAMQALLDTKIGITKMRGQLQDYPRIPGIKVLPTFHPAYLLRSPDKKREAWEDLKKVRAFLRGEL